MARVQQISTAVATSDMVPTEVLFGVTEELKRIRRTVDRVTGVRVPVLIRGESGTGKEVLANYIHARGPKCPS